MKKTIFVTAFSISLLSSCGSKGSSPISIENDTCHIELFFHKFMARFPDGLNNSIKKKKMNEVFVSEITDSLSNSYWLLEDYPLCFKNIQYGKSGLCYVHFQSWIKPDGFSFKDYDFNGCYDFNGIFFDLIGEVSTRYVDILKEDEYYIIRGKLKRFLRHSEFENYTEKSAYTPIIGIEREIGSRTSVNWQLGEMLFDIDTIYNYKSKHQ